MRQTENLGLALYESTDKMNITGAENSLNHNMELIDAEMEKTMKTPEAGETGQVLTKTEAGFAWKEQKSAEPLSDLIELSDDEGYMKELLGDLSWSEKGSFYGTNGLTEGSTYNFYALPLVDVIPGQTYRLTCRNAASYISGLCYFYDSNKSKGVKSAEISDFMRTSTSVDIVIPDDAYYLGLSYTITTNDLTMMRITKISGSSGLYNLKNLRLTDDNAKTVSLLPNITKNTIVNMGDSIFGNDDTETGISNLLSEILNCTVYNCAFGGTRAIRRSGDPTGYEEFDFSTLVDSIISGDFTTQENALTEYGGSMGSYYGERLARLKSIDFSTVNILTVNYGTNDYSWYVKNTFITGYEEAIGKLQSAFPQIKVIMLTPTYRFWYDEDGTWKEDGDTRIGSNDTTIKMIVEDVKTVAENMHLKCIDLYNCGINKYNCLYYYPSNDGTHQNENGRRYLADKIAKGILIS